jgi:histone H3/H4
MSSKTLLITDINILMENITKVSIKRLSKCANIKTISDDCYDVIKDLIETKLKDILSTASMIMTEENNKTLSPSHIHQALELLNNEYICQS